MVDVVVSEVVAVVVVTNVDVVDGVVDAVVVVAGVADDGCKVHPCFSYLIVSTATVPVL